MAEIYYFFLQYNIYNSQRECLPCPIKKKNAFVDKTENVCTCTLRVQCAHIALTFSVIYIISTKYTVF